MSGLPDPITINGERYVKVGQIQMARFFCEMDAVEQAMFLNVVAEESSKWMAGRVLQWAIISEHLTDGARKLAAEWAEYFEAPK